MDRVEFEKWAATEYPGQPEIDVLRDMLTVAQGNNTRISAHNFRLCKENAALQAEVEGLRKDAERYRKLRKYRAVLLLTGFFGNGCVNRNMEEVDAAIDAMKERK